eukprot:1158876-Pelagomonas_calceolata.AAC.7
MRGRIGLKPNLRTQTLQRLNAQGYGIPGSGLRLDLVYNPSGPFLAPAQDGCLHAEVHRYVTQRRSAS